MKNKVNFVIVGNFALDVNTFPGRDNGKDKVVVNRGGAGYYSLIPASIFARTGIVTKAGNDSDIEPLKKNSNIDLTGLKVIENSTSSKFHHTYLTDDGKTRTFRSEVYEETMIDVEDFPKEYFDASYIHIATNFPDKQKRFIELIRENSNAIISIDTHEAYLEQYPDEIRELFDSVDIAFIDKEYTSLIDCKAPIKIHKLGKIGCKYESENLSFFAQTQECEVIDKTGSGDVVTGVFMAEMANGEQPKEALQKAVKVATKSVGGYGVDFLIDLYK